MSEPENVPPGVDLAKASPARLYDFYLGGKANYPIDREAAEQIRAVVPELEDIAWANRGFLQRAVHKLASLGIRQFIDVGAGLPTQNNTHQVARSVIPDARVLYADNDPMVVAHARALLAGSPDTAVITADLRHPEELLAQEPVHELIDFTRPVGLLMVAVLHFVSDDDDPLGLVGRYLAELPSGSYLALSHGTADFQAPRALKAIADVYADATESAHFRTRAEISRLFGGLELLPPYDGAAPDVAYAGDWGADDPETSDSDGSRWVYCGVAKLL
jgi:hypothetical protein